MKAKKRVNVCISERVLERLDFYANYLGMSRSELIEHIVTSEIKCFELERGVNRG